MRHRRTDGIKRLADVSVAVVLLIATAPLQALVAAAVRLSMGRPVLFRQLRPGLQARPFVLLKFRTMRPVDDHELVDELRLTSLGSLLRRSSLDELPSLWNVVKGDMSLVGPRPLLMEYLPLYSREEARRHEVRPGITGLAQVSGRNLVDWERRFQLDVDYVERRGPLLDLKILGQTFAVVLCRRGISAEGHVTMPPFAGSPAPASRDR